MPDVSSAVTTPLAVAQHTVTMLTTIDNPHDPFTDWDLWVLFDETNQHYTNAYLARIIGDVSDMTDEELRASQELAITEIMELNTTGLYRTVSIQKVDQFIESDELLS